MKRTLSFFVVLVACIVVLNTSCSGTEQLTEEVVMTSQDMEMSKICNSIDSLQTNYRSLGDSRGFSLGKWQRRFLCGFVDACVGTVTIETGPVGSFVFSTLASGLYDDYLDVVLGSAQCQYSENAQNKTSMRQVGVIFADRNTSFIDSIGYYHNVVLSEIRSKGKSFVDAEGKIDYKEYFNEIVSVSKKYGIPSGRVDDSSDVLKYIDIVIKNLAKEIDIERNDLVSIIFNEAFSDFKYNDTQTKLLHNVIDKIIYDDLCVSYEELISYGTQVNNIIENSNIDNDIKNVMRVANNLSINSSLFWNDN